MQLREIDHPGAAVFHIKGRLDAASTPELEQKVLLSLDRGITHLIMDFSELEYINSAGLRILVMSYQRLNPQGGQVMCAECGTTLPKFSTSPATTAFSPCAATCMKP